MSRFCKEAGFVSVVEVGQHLVTKDTGDFRQFRSVACREYTLLRDDRASQPKGWIQGNMRIGPVLEVTTSFKNFKYGIEIRIESVNQDDSHSWIRISYGMVKYVIDSIQDNTEILADPQEEQTPPTSTSVVAARSKAKAKPIHQRRWIDIKPSKQQSDVTLRRRWSNSILQDLNSISEIIIHKYRIGLMIDGKFVCLQAEDPNEDISIVLISWE